MGLKHSLRRAKRKKIETADHGDAQLGDASFGPIVNVYDMSGAVADALVDQAPVPAGVAVDSDVEESVDVPPPKKEEED